MGDRLCIPYFLPTCLYVLALMSFVLAFCVWTQVGCFCSASLCWSAS